MHTAEAPVPTSTIDGPFGRRRIVDLAGAAGPDLLRMPVCHRILLENVLRQDDPEAAAAGRDALLGWLSSGRSEAEIPFAPLRILMHDTTCGPALVDIAAMRDALAEAGGDPERLNPSLPVATSTDHSVAVDVAGTPDALARNMEREIGRNAERYGFMKWASAALRGFRVFPPGTGIMHTINMERIATVVATESRDGADWAVPDTLIGTDSHTPMVNGIGVLGWGVGGIEAEGAMFGVPVSLRVPEVIGVRLRGTLPRGTLATDLALEVTHLLRKRGVAGEFVEFFGPGLSTLAAGERAVVSNMAPEYGATTGFFPIDARTTAYLAGTGRSAGKVALVEAYARANGLWFDPEAAPRYTDVLEVDLSRLGPAIAGPRRPQDRMAPSAVAGSLTRIGHGDGAIPQSAVAIAAITSCTNTTDFGLLVTAGLLARNARRKGMAPAPWVKTSLAPGSPAAGARLSRAGLMDDLEALGFAVAGYGCTTCIGNSGPLLPAMADAVERGEFAPVAVLSGNRNFPGRVHAQVEQSLLASPPLVVAYALAGHAGLDVTQDALGTDRQGNPVHLSDLWPAEEEVGAAIEAGTEPSMIGVAYAEAEASRAWAALPCPTTPRFPWDPNSTYLRRPPFVGFAPKAEAADALVVEPLLVLGDDITTDHISPAGAIAASSDAGRWLTDRGEDPHDLNVYASRRGNWEVMLRGLFTNRTVRNHLGPDLLGGMTICSATGDVVPAWRAAALSTAAGRRLAIVAGERYGTGSSRDWAAKGVQLLGVAAILANSFERIHRANLVCMGILPVRMPEGWRPAELGLRAGDRIRVGLDRLAVVPRADVLLTIERDGSVLREARGVVLVETGREAALIRAGGIIPTILSRAFGATAYAQPGMEAWSRSRRTDLYGGAP